MEYITRYLENEIKADLPHKMVFLTGPRQSGKTTLAKKLLADSNSTLSPSYLNWDAEEDRERIIREQFPPGNGMLVLDEIHIEGSTFKQKRLMLLAELFFTIAEPSNQLFSPAYRKTNSC